MYMLSLEINILNLELLDSDRWDIQQVLRIYLSLPPLIRIIGACPYTGHFLHHSGYPNSGPLICLVITLLT